MLSYAFGLGLAREQREYVYVSAGGVKLGYTSHTKPAFLCPKLLLYPSKCLRPVTLKPGDVLDHGIAWRVAVVMMAVVVIPCW